MIFVVIYLGAKLPKYVLRNLIYLKSTFNDVEIYFVSEAPDSLLKVEKHGIKTWQAPNPDLEWKVVREGLEHPLDFRDGFWFKTLARLFVLNSFMNAHPDQSCLQIEADVFLFPNFPVAKFQGLDADISFPMESKHMGIASLLYLRDQDSSRILTELALSSIQENSQITDMSLLGKVAHSKALRFLPLPTLPESIPEALNDFTAKKLVCNNSLNDSGVFDGISVGQYLLGIDPRNSRGKLILYRNHSTHAIDPRKLKIRLDSKDELSLIGDGTRTVIYNLHNHSKDLRMYKVGSRNKLLQKRIGKSNSGEKRVLIPSIFLRLVSVAIMKRAKMLIHIIRD